MGNCAFKDNHALIKVVTFNGGVMELYPPITAECVTNGFPGHGVYRSPDRLSKPLLHNEELVGGEMYYLRPFNGSRFTGVPSVVAPYRVSLDSHGFLMRPRQDLDMWKVNLVINRDELAKIFAEDSRTGELIESVRTVAKCGVNGSGSGSGSVASSDQWSLASSTKGATSENTG